MDPQVNLKYTQSLLPAGLSLYKPEVLLELFETLLWKNINTEIYIDPSMGIPYHNKSPFALTKTEDKVEATPLSVKQFPWKATFPLLSKVVKHIIH